VFQTQYSVRTTLHRLITPHFVVRRLVLAKVNLCSNFQTQQERLIVYKNRQILKVVNQQFHRSHTTSYLSSTVAVSLHILNCFRYIGTHWLKIANFTYPCIFSTSPALVAASEPWRFSTVSWVWDNQSSVAFTGWWIPASDGRVDEWQTLGHIAHAALCVCFAFASRGKIGSRK